MKINFFTVVFSIITTVIITTSCLKDDDTVYVASKNASITAFSIPGNIETKVASKTSAGKDTTIIETVDGSDYKFAIDQLNRQIYNVDSLPVGTDISKVVVSITADTQTIVFVNKNNQDSLWVSTDSMNFEKPIEFKVYSQEGLVGPTYTAKINVHKQVPDSLSWNGIEGNFQGASFTAQKAVSFNDKIMVFAEGNNQVLLTQTNISDGNVWTTPTAINIPEKAIYSSVMVWGSNIYILAGNKLYVSSDAETWSVANSSITFYNLIANYYANSNDAKIYALAENNNSYQFVESTDGKTWNVSSQPFDNDFPTSNISYASFPLSHNNAIYNTVVIGNNGSTKDTTTVAWARLNNENQWSEYSYNNSSKPLPRLENVTMIGYNNSLYAFGKPFNYIYISSNNGVSWDKQTSLVMFPESFASLYTQANGDYSCTVDSNNFIWIMWSKSGQVWKGRVNRLGFETNN